MGATSFENNERRLPPTLRDSNPWLARITLIAVSVLILTNLIAALMAAAFQVYHDGLIYPGVSVWGIELGGMQPEEAMNALNGQFTYPSTAEITFREGEQTWTTTAGALGVRFDTARTVQAAYEVGRNPAMLMSLREQVTAWRQGVQIAPVIVYDETLADDFVTQIALRIDQPPQDATLRIDGYRAVTTEAFIGREVDKAATLAALGEMVVALESGELPVVIRENEPKVLDASAAAAQIDAILNSDLVLEIESPRPDDPGPWIAGRDALLNMIEIERVPLEDGYHEELRVSMRQEEFLAFLNPLVSELGREPVDARLLFDDSSRQLTSLVESQDGRRLDVDATVEAIMAQIETPDHNVPLVFEVLEPEIRSDSSAEELGITEMIVQATTYFGGSSQGRRGNVEEAAGRFHGVVIGPGEVFSFNEYLGDVSTETGFEEALIIYNGRTITGVGGGVCQVSTTAFQAAFWAGFPILERVPHGYRVGYYDTGEGPGMDATVYWPVVDMKFQNDTPYYLLIETEFNNAASTLTFRFYSTKDGRTVQKDGPFLSNTQPHGEALYEVNPEFSPGQVKQVDYAVDGVDVRVNRTVIRNGVILYQDTFFSQYIPWQAIYQVAPGDPRASGR